jgi:hypothetical protein
MYKYYFCLKKLWIVSDTEAYIPSVVNVMNVKNVGIKSVMEQFRLELGNGGRKWISIDILKFHVFSMT